MTKQVQQAIIPTHVLGSTGTADTSDLGYRALGSFKGDLGLGTSLTQTANNGNGTATNPAFTFTGDPNTGIIRAAADALGLVTNGSEKVRIDDAGNVGIGRSAPSERLDVNGRILSRGAYSLVAAVGGSGAGDVDIDLSDFFSGATAANSRTFLLLLVEASTSANTQQTTYILFVRADTNTINLTQLAQNTVGSNPSLLTITCPTAKIVRFTRAGFNSANAFFTALNI